MNGAIAAVIDGNGDTRGTKLVDCRSDVDFWITNKDGLTSGGLVGKVNSNSGVADSASLQSIYSISDVALKEPDANGLTDSKVGVDMIGSYQDGNIVAGDHNFVLATDQLTLIDNGDEVATGRFRAYFHVPGTTAENLEIAVDGIITGIRLTTTKQAVNKATYSLQGVKMEQGKRLKKGVYIRDNQKVIVR